MANQEHALMTQVIELIRNGSFVEGYTASDEECLGLALSHYFEWSRVPILKACREALEDANFEAEAELIDLLLDRRGPGSSAFARELIAHVEDLAGH